MASAVLDKLGALKKLASWRLSEDEERLFTETKDTITTLVTEVRTHAEARRRGCSSFEVI